LKTNLHVLKIVDTIDVKERAEIILSIALELRKLCNKIIPELEKYHKTL
jgi:ACT domain-containing protein